MANTNLSLIPQNFPVTVNMLVVLKGAEKMETEKSVIEVLEFEIPFGQGHVFGAPRPIKGTLQDETAPPPDFVRRVSAAAI